jgi:hypothetical protein
MVATPLMGAIYQPTDHHIEKTLTVEDLISTKNRNLEALLGVDLNWKQKLALGMVKRKLKKAVKKDPALAKRSFSDLAATLPADLTVADERKTHPNAVVSFVGSLAGLLILTTLGALGFLVCIAALIFGFLALSKIRKAPDQFKGRGWAWAGIGISAFIIAIILIAVSLFIRGY